ncbi:zinc ribbon domain-containing protein [Nonomuraea sp. NPDC000554]|uniref:zinc ribbon domain-containing protein n=1 Tax=Nonomuraea sp. NPDC000554 TaxID=3154259 RepID=UPI00332AF733
MSFTRPSWPPKTLTPCRSCSPSEAGGKTGRRLKAARHPYILRGVLFCGACERRMQGNWTNGAPYYRCGFLRSTPWRIGSGILATPTSERTRSSRSSIDDSAACSPLTGSMRRSIS